ncbi:transmembrane 220 family protein [Pareuzebyella sediminis]|uniref:transmembrane 220 family protein n=1 Tax=Pareuzebyella sediminis TaxID=2607998 RepID=UPI0011ED7C84|nr:transmembrane 220 family protein [Pareuzebyella sediminis]
MNVFFKALSIIFALLFIWAAYLQYNDPDALLWYAIYGVAGLGSILFAVNRLGLFLALILCLAYLIGTVALWPERFEGFTIGQGDIVNIERGREAFGLLIVALVFLMYGLRIYFSKKSKV